MPFFVKFYSINTYFSSSFLAIFAFVPSSHKAISSSDLVDSNSSFRSLNPISRHRLCKMVQARITFDASSSWYNVIPFCYTGNRLFNIPNAHSMGFLALEAYFSHSTKSWSSFCSFLLMVFIMFLDNRNAQSPIR